jgi:hypothetical protein
MDSGNKERVLCPGKISTDRNLQISLVTDGIFKDSRHKIFIFNLTKFEELSI